MTTQEVMTELSQESELYNSHFIPLEQQQWGHNHY